MEQSLHEPAQDCCRERPPITSVSEVVDDQHIAVRVIIHDITELCRKGLMPDCNAIHGQQWPVVADAILHIVTFDEYGQRIADLADAVKGDAAVPPGTILIGVAPQGFIAHAVVQVIHVEALAKAMQAYLTPVGCILVLERRLLEREHRAAQEAVLVRWLQATQQGTGPLDGGWLEDDVVVHEQDVVDAALLDVLDHGARETATAAVVAVVDNAQGRCLLCRQGTAIVDHKDAEPTVRLLEVRQGLHRAAHVLLTLEGTDADTDLAALPCGCFAVIRTGLVSSSCGQGS